MIGSSTTHYHSHTTLWRNPNGGLQLCQGQVLRLWGRWTSIGWESVGKRGASCRRIQRWIWWVVQSEAQVFFQCYSSVNHISMLRTCEAMCFFCFGASLKQLKNCFAEFCGMQHNWYIYIHNGCKHRCPFPIGWLMKQEGFVYPFNNRSMMRQSPRSTIHTDLKKTDTSYNKHIIYI